MESPWGVFQAAHAKCPNASCSVSSKISLCRMTSPASTNGKVWHHLVYLGTKMIQNHWDLRSLLLLSSHVYWVAEIQWQGLECLWGLPWFSMGLPSSPDGKVTACNAGNPGLIPGSGRSSEEGNGNPLQCSCLENSRDRGAWWAVVHGLSKSRTWLNDFPFFSLIQHGWMELGCRSWLLVFLNFCPVFSTPH